MAWVAICIPLMVLVVAVAVVPLLVGMRLQYKDVDNALPTTRAAGSGVDSPASAPEEQHLEIGDLVRAA